MQRIQIGRCLPSFGAGQRKYDFIIEKEEKMIIFKEKSQPLLEMADFTGFGIIIRVRSDDHGTIGNKSSPAHAHILDASKNEKGEIVIKYQTPSDASDVEWYRTPNPPAGLGKKVSSLATSKNKKLEKAGINQTMWQSIISQWIYFHGN